jgi:hypothetical protein
MDMIFCFAANRQKHSQCIDNRSKEINSTRMPMLRRTACTASHAHPPLSDWPMGGRRGGGA